VPRPGGLRRWSGLTTNWELGARTLYFWRIHRLKSDLRARDLPAREVFAYATAYVVVLTLGMLIPPEDTDLGVGEVVALGVSSLLISVMGLWAAYRANGGSEGRDLAGRLLALSWVIGLRISVLILSGMMVVALVVAVQATMAGREMSNSAIVVMAWTVVLLSSLTFYWRLAYHLKDLRRAPQPPPAADSGTDTVT
jgi:hypothetical protein